jgi:ferritin-like metal-binding protein YciE
MTVEKLKEAFIFEISDMYDGEKQISKALVEMTKAATDPNLIDAFGRHLAETEDQIRTLEQIAESAGFEFKSETCDGIKGLIAEGREIIKNVKQGPVCDAMLIAAAQKVEHYEIATYGTLATLAREINLEHAAGLLEQILAQEKSTDEKLNTLAVNGINARAAQAA